MTDAKQAMGEAAVRARSDLRIRMGRNDRARKFAARHPISLFRYLTGRCYFQRPEWKELMR